MVSTGWPVVVTVVCSTMEAARIGVSGRMLSSCRTAGRIKCFFCFIVFIFAFILLLVNGFEPGAGNAGLGEPGVEELDDDIGAAAQLQHAAFDAGEYALDHTNPLTEG